MKQLYEVREKHGGVFVTCFDDGLLVPWKPLSMGDFIRYTLDHNRKLHLPVWLEDEIFRKCVVDKSILRQMDFLKAGVVSTVVLNIWQYSGPASIDGFNNDLHAARSVLNADGVKAIHDLVQVISMAFPYKPEEIYDMDYETFLFRLAQSEKKLMDLNALKEPIAMQNTSQPNMAQSALEEFAQEQAIRQGGAPPEPAVNAKRLWDEQQGHGAAEELWKQHLKKVQRAPKKKVPVQRTDEKWWKKSPVLEAKERHNIDFNTEAAEMTAFGSTGHEKQDAFLDHAKMIEDAQWIYADLIKELEKKNAR